MTIKALNKFLGWNQDQYDACVKADIARGEMTKAEFAEICGYTIESVIANFDNQIGDASPARVTPATMDAARYSEAMDSAAPEALP